MRRSAVGDVIEVDGLVFRIVQGRKGEHDQVLELYDGRTWRPVTFAVGFVIMDVLGQNEDYLYPYPARGGGYLRAALLTAWRDGWRVAWSDLQRERADVAARRELEVGL